MSCKVAFALILNTCFLTSAPAQTAVQPAQTTAEPARKGLKIIVLEGDGAINDVDTRTAMSPVVEVRDENNRPVEGAQVVFRLPASGPGGVFTGGKPSFTTKTNLQGQAQAAPIILSSQKGRFNIQVSAAIGNRIGEAVISQSTLSNVPSERVRVRRFGWWKWAAIGGGAAAVTAVVLLTRGGDDAPSITITPGPGTVVIGGR